MRPATRCLVVGLACMAGCLNEDFAVDETLADTTDAGDAAGMDGAAAPVPGDDAGTDAGSDAGVGIVDTDDCDVGLEPCFECDNATVVFDYWVCDSEDDCGDGSDEVDCDYCESDPDGCWECRDGSGNVHGEQRCDGIEQCADGTDEIIGACWECDNGNIIRPSWLCDAVDDCGDGSDERDCP